MESTIIHIADLFGTAVFAVTGALAGVYKKLDLLGVVVLSCAVGIGGGVFRDCTIGAVPCAALTDEMYLTICVITALLVFRTPGAFFLKHKAAIVYLDAVGLGVFTALGVTKALQVPELPAVTAVLAGVITAVGGGVVRDVLVNEIPVVLRSDFYATASLIGGVLYLFLHKLGWDLFNTFIFVAIMVMTIRLWAYRHKLQLPKAE
jgi:uncharacterized membrane protein YeiH